MKWHTGLTGATYARHTFPKLMIRRGCVLPAGISSRITATRPETRTRHHPSNARSLRSIQLPLWMRPVSKLQMAWMRLAQAIGAVELRNHKLRKQAIVGQGPRPGDALGVD